MSYGPPTTHPIVTGLLAAVPLRTLELQSIPSDDDFWRTFKQWTSDAAEVLGRVGEAVLYRTENGDSAEGFNAVVRAIAALSFVPGGITVFGYHWENTRNGPSSTLTPSSMGVPEPDGHS